MIASCVHVSVIVTVTNETLVAGPTMRAADAAIARAEGEGGLKVERLIAFDNPSTDARHFFEQAALSHWTKAEIHGGDLGTTRNRAVAEFARGKAVAFCDADDLFSENWLTCAWSRLEQARALKQPKTIVHPELNWIFDREQAVQANIDQDDLLFSPLLLAILNPYDSLFLAPRAAWLDVPVAVRDPASGLSYGDWQHAVELMAAGWRHVTAPDTIIFKRRRDRSLMTENRAAGLLLPALPELRIDRVYDLAKPSGEDGRQRHGDPAAAAPAPALPPDEALARLRALRARELAETPYYGHALQQRIARAQATVTGNTGGGLKASNVNLVRQNFDYAWYLATYHDIACNHTIDPVAHYLRAGAPEGRDPSPLFATREYVDHYQTDGWLDTARPAFAQWLAQGAGQGQSGRPFPEMGALARLLGRSTAELEALWATRYLSLRERLMFGELGRQAALASRLDALVAQAWPEALRVRIPILHGRPVIRRLGALAEAHHTAGYRTARAVVLVSGATPMHQPGRGRLERQVAASLAGIFGHEHVIVIRTDHVSAAGSAWADAELGAMRCVDFARLAITLDPAQASRTLADLVRSLAPEVVFCIESNRWWHALRDYAPGLAQSMALHCFLPDHEVNGYGHGSGRTMHRFYRLFGHLAGAFTESQALADELAWQHLMPGGMRGKLHTLPLPVDDRVEAVAAASRPAGQRPRVFWVNPTGIRRENMLVTSIARTASMLEFHLWAGGAGIAPLVNITKSYPCTRIGALPLAAADIWLCTAPASDCAVWLLDAAMAGIPIVTRDTADTRSMLADAGGEPCAALVPGDTADPAEFAKALCRLNDDPGKARAQALRLRTLLSRERTPAAFTARLRRQIEAGWSPERAAIKTRD